MKLQCKPLFPIFFKAKVITNELIIKICLSDIFIFSRGRRHFYSTTGGDTVIENCDKLEEDSVGPTLSNSAVVHN